ncbi:hypothetical protein GGS20DRAFT_543254 [Poronia punctata]|nr:hypothetical protein GGS20DRAFT_543254 [Poronia punctata]
MENPEEQIPQIIHSLTQGTREEQVAALNDYFLPDAYFIHPFCRVPSFEPRVISLPFGLGPSWTLTSRWLVQLIYQWYKILSPVILLEVDSTAFDRKTNSLYATIHQTFTLWFIPFSLWQANVKLVCLLQLAHIPVDNNNKPLLHSASSSSSSSSSSSQQQQQQNSSTKRYRYFIRGQEDHYQVNEFLKFIAPFGASVVWYMWQVFALFLCALGIPFLGPLKAVYSRVFLDNSPQRRQKELSKRR